MRKVIVSEFVTLDGVMEAPNQWHFPYWSDEIRKYKSGEMFASDALLMGRVTYEGFAASWPLATDQEGFADRMNALPKHVASATLEGTLEWNASPIGGDVAEAVSRLKGQVGGDLLVYRPDREGAGD